MNAMLTVSMQRTLAALLVGVYMCMPTAPVFAQAPDIAGVEVIENSDTSVTITWETDEDSDSLVNYGLQPDYGIVRIPGSDRTVHEVTLDDLEPGRMYFFRVVSADEDGNQGISADYRFETGDITESDAGQGPAAGEGESDSDTTTTAEQVEQITEDIQEIQDVEQLEQILEVTIQAIQGITDDLTIVGPPTVTPETTTALVEWTTDREADSVVLFSPASSFTPGQYQFSQSSTDGASTEHSVQIIGLDPFTEYHFQVQSTDAAGITGESQDYTFTTKASLPNIQNLRILKVEENAATLAWDTSVPAKALVEYQDMSTGDQNSVGRPTLATTHQMRISDLTLGTRYVAFVTAENAGGDRVKSQPLTFVTVKDEAPPIISNVKNDSTIFPGNESRIQTIVEWNTDEPSSCVMTYREGVSEAVEPTIIEQDTINYTAQHVEVIVDFAPATVYQFWLDCTDEAGNTATSEDFVLFTPIQEKNIIDLILENFEATFGWVRNITN